MNRNVLLTILAAGIVAAGAMWPAAAQGGSSYVIYVAPKDTPAFAAAQARARPPAVQAERTLFRALETAGTLLNGKGLVSVTIAVAGGDFRGQVGAGTWPVPRVVNPQGTLRILGGFSADFGARQPFGN